MEVFNCVISFIKGISSKKNRWILYFIIISLICIAIVHVLYKIPAISPFFESTWESGYALSFFGSIIGAASTIYVLRETIKTTLSQQKEEQAYLIRPYIMVYAGDFSELDKCVKSIPELPNDNWDGDYDIFVKFVNVGAGNAVGVKMDYCYADSPEIIQSVELPPLMINENNIYRIQKCPVTPIKIALEYYDIANLKHYKEEILLELTCITNTIDIKVGVPSVTII